MKRAMLVLALLALPVVAGVAWADPIGPDCESCFGNIFTLQSSNVTTNSTTSLDVTLTIDTTSTTLSASDVIRDIAFKITSQSSDVLATPTLTSTTAGTTADWTVGLGGLNNNGCTSGTQGFICAADGDVAHLDGSTYTWVFHVEVANGSLIDPATIKARYCVGGTDCEGNNFQGLTSENIHLQPVGGQPVGGQPVGGQPVGGQVPEPASLLLVGAGLLGLGVASAGLGRMRGRLQE